MVQMLLFIFGSIFFLYVSRRSLLNPGSHGFYRFFVFEGVLTLLLLNHPYWFRDPFSAGHLVSWLLLSISIYCIVHSLIMLKKQGGHAEREDMPENFSFENTVHVVDEGLYRYIRHPMYGSLLFLGWGAFLKNITPFTLGLVLFVTGFLIVVVKVEERENIRFFGADYEVYMKRSRMFIPWIL